VAKELAMNFKKLEAMFETANNGDVSLLKKYLSENFFWRSITQSSLAKNKRDKSETIAWFEEQPRSNIGKITCHFENDKIIVYQHSVPDHVEPDGVILGFVKIEKNEIIEMSHARGKRPLSKNG
jgi:hypothetical protein